MNVVGWFAGNERSVIPAGHAVSTARITTSGTRRIELAADEVARVVAHRAAAPLVEDGGDEAQRVERGEHHRE